MNFECTLPGKELPPAPSTRPTTILNVKTWGHPVPLKLSGNISLNWCECCLLPECTQEPKAPLVHVWGAIYWYGKGWEKENEMRIQTQAVVQPPLVYIITAPREMHC